MTKIAWRPGPISRAPPSRHSLPLGTPGSERMFGSGGIYNSLLWFFLIGAIAPVHFYLLRKKVKAFESFHFPWVDSSGCPTRWPTFGWRSQLASCSIA
ncbi:hypothetical protein DFH07DRAFT_110135 [Mycena maculata]|uniref:Uncharacterized protein n=1 Tax=Mycena maculata TaxID=230809 RepID=A0AAD7I7U8_9AGAR|nr:hypothetical protein DFH07DRAFT_110135 [Mycena maculata]